MGPEDIHSDSFHHLFHFSVMSHSKIRGWLCRHGKPSLGLSPALLGTMSEEFTMSLWEKHGHKCVCSDVFLEVRHSPRPGL